jgi:hypothetical protein
MGYMRIETKRAIFCTLSIVMVWLFEPVKVQAQLLSQWHFNETSGNIAFDSVGTNHGILSATGSNFAPGQGIQGGAIQLSIPNNGLVNMGNIFNFDGTTSFSLIAWVKVNNPSGSTLGMIPLSRHSGGFQNGYFLAVNDTGDGLAGSSTKAHLYSSGQLTPPSTIVVNDGSWHQIIGVHNVGAGVEQLYVDGQFQSSNSLNNPFNTQNVPFLIGGTTSGGITNGTYTGLVDEVSVYGNALSGFEINSIYLATTAVPEPSSLLLGACGLAGGVLWRRRFLNRSRTAVARR